MNQSPGMFNRKSESHCLDLQEVMCSFIMLFKVTRRSEAELVLGDCAF